MNASHQTMGTEPTSTPMSDTPKPTDNVLLNCTVSSEHIKNCHYPKCIHIIIKKRHTIQNAVDIFSTINNHHASYPKSHNLNPPLSAVP